mmetsp:Transcript_22048/g.65794  ORF Transcript_22048/g.65794 Transcript_22048/m.65794 type:complete len:280 (+) Transcript_22048:849-1688(+)
MVLHLRLCQQVPGEELAPVAHPRARGAARGVQDAQDQPVHRLPLGDHNILRAQLLRRVQQQRGDPQVRQQHAECLAIQLLTPPVPSAELHGHLLLEHAFRHREGHGDAVLHAAPVGWPVRRGGGAARLAAGPGENLPQLLVRGREQHRGPGQPAGAVGRGQRRQGGEDGRGRRPRGPRPHEEEGAHHRAHGPDVQDAAAGERDRSPLERRLPGPQDPAGPPAGREGQAELGARALRTRGRGGLVQRDEARRGGPHHHAVSAQEIDLLHPGAGRTERGVG